MILRLALAFTLAGAAPLAGAVKGELRKSSREYKNVNKELSSAKRTLARQAQAEAGLLRQMEGLARKVDAAGRDQRTHQRNLEIVEGRLAALARKNAEASAEIAANRAALARQLRLLHRAGAVSGARMLLTTQGPGQWMARYRFLKVLATQNSARVASTRDRLARIEEYSREYRTREAELKGHQRETEAARQRAEAERRRREGLLKGVRQKKSQTQALVGQLAAAAEALSRKMEELREAAEAAERQEREREERASERKERAPGRHGAAQIDRGPSRLGAKRSLPWPVKGALLTRFGQQPHPRFRTTIFNRGVEIGAEAGAPVSAVAAGTARFAGEFDGFGQMVILDHGGGTFSTYANNSALLVKEGERVAAGQAIAEVGESPTLGRPTLYFEIRNGAKPQDPMLWLRRKP